jgi:hypothetical protein
MIISETFLREIGFQILDRSYFSADHILHEPVDHVGDDEYVVITDCEPDRSTF